jgi:hypothetical protein
MFTGKLSMAEENMKEALGLLESLGLETDLTSCELYNSIAQLMVLKHRQWHNEKKTRCKKATALWIDSTEGMKALAEETSKLLKHQQSQLRSEKDKIDYDGNFASSRPLSPRAKLLRESAEAKAKLNIVKTHIRELMANESDPTLPSVEAAYRYLVRSFEILEQVHGSQVAQ